MTTLELVSKHFQVGKKVLINEGLVAFLQKKKSEILRDRIAILVKYNVDSLKELENLVKKGKVSEHPAWEDLITLENIDKELKVIAGDIRRIQKAC